MGFMKRRLFHAKSGSKGGKRAALGGLFVRSAWENNVCLHLISLKERGEIHDWKYESAEFQFPVKRGTRFYKPDFTVWHSEGAEPEYWEVKGHLDAKSVTALTRMKKYHPSVTVLLIGKEQYKEIEAQSGHLEGWE